MKLNMQLLVRTWRDKREVTIAQKRAKAVISKQHIDNESILPFWSSKMVLAVVLATTKQVELIMTHHSSYGSPSIFSP